MNKRNIAVAALLVFAFFCPQACRAQAAAAAEPGNDYTLSQSFTSGAHKYRNSVTGLGLLTASGLDLRAEGGAFKSAASSSTPNFAFGLSKQWESFYLGLDYSFTGKVNDMQTRTLGTDLAWRTGRSELRTTVGAGGQLQEIEFFNMPGQKSTKKLQQRTGTIKVKQRFYGLLLTAAMSGSSYDKDLMAVTQKIAMNPDRFAGVGGLVGTLTGFPSWSSRWAAYQDLPWLPVTLWGSYEGTRMMNTAFSHDVTADSITAGADLDLAKWLTVTPEINRVRETGQKTVRYYTLALSATF